MAATTAVKLVAEFLGAFLLMISILVSGGSPLIIGATLALIVFVIGGVSGASVNPAVSAGLWYSGTLSTQLFALYSVVEVLGAVSAVVAYNTVA
jgi:glycerol uptake facilitator-like aquaporin